MKKIKQFLRGSWGKRMVACMAIACVFSCMGVAASADTAPTVDPATITNGVQTVTDSVVANFNISTIASIIGIVLAACVGLFLFWWGARKVVRMVSSAFKKGRISL